MSRSPITRFRTLRALRKAGMALIMDHEPLPGLRILHDAAGLTDADYESPDLLRARLGHWLGRLPVPVAAAYVMALSGALGMVRRHQHGLLVLETFLGVAMHDYRDGRYPADTLTRRFAQLPGDLGLGLFLSLIQVLGLLGRESEGTTLLAGYLGLGDSGDAEAGGGDAETLLERFTAHMSRQRQVLEPDAFAMLWLTVGAELDELGLGSAGIPVLETGLGLAPDDYRSPELLDRKLSSWSGALAGPVTGVMVLALLSNLLAELDRRDDALAVIEWCVGVSAEDYGDVVALGGAWRRFCAEQAPDVGPSVWRTWSHTLVEAGRGSDLLSLIIADTGLLPGETADPDRFGPKLTRRLAQAQIDTQAAYVYSLVDVLDQIDPAGAARILDWYLLGYPNLWSPTEGGDPGVRHVVALLVQWFEKVAPASPDEVWRLSDQAVRYLRRSLPMSEMSLVDRREFIGWIDRLRRHILLVGDTADRDDQILLAQLWDAELDQRLLFERFLLTSIGEVPIAEPPQDRWPLTGPEPRGAAGGANHLPDPAACPDSELLRLLAADWPTPARVSPPSGAHSSPGASHPPEDSWLREAEDLIRDGVTPDLVAEVLGGHGVLVRLSFRADDALVGAALRTDRTGTLRVVAAGTGQPGDRWRLRWASLRHDLGLLLVILGRTAEQAFQTLVTDLTTTLDTLTSAVEQMLDPGEEPQPLLARMAEALDAYAAAPSSQGSGAGLADRLRGILAIRLGSGWDRDWARQVRPELAAVRATVDRHSAARPEASAAFEEIDGVTRTYLAEVAALWPLETLTTVLDPTDDLVFQLEDTLQGVPVAHLPLADGRPLYTLVRSTRVSLSLLMTILQSRIEESFAADADRILAVSHFDDPDVDPSSSYAKWLHHGQRLLARQTNLTCLNAAESPPGSVGGLRAALLDHPEFQTVTVCGHGSTTADGIALAEPDPWQGDGCDWRGVNLLLLVSCSVGRVRQDEDQDVEGLCVRLALNRARAILACRWPVVTPHAIAFANEVVAQYLALRRAGDTGEGSLRARALNAARHRFIGAGNTRRPGQLASLTTVAAFELYGLG